MTPDIKFYFELLKKRLPIMVVIFTICAGLGVGMAVTMPPKYTADAAVNVTVEYRASFVNLLLNGLTFGIWAPARAHVTGTIVKYQ